MEVEYSKKFTYVLNVSSAAYGYTAVATDTKIVMKKVPSI